MSDGKLRLLLVEDQDADALLVEEAVAGLAPAGWAEVIHVRCLEQLDVEALTGVDCVLLDLGLPGCSGLEALHRLLARFPGVPTVVLTGRDADDVAVAALSAGALDYVTKQDLSGRRLRRAVRYALERYRLRTQLTGLNERLDQFNRIVAHDLRSPLSIIKLAADVLEEQPTDDPSTRRLLTTISTAAHQALTMIDDLLAYSRAGELPLEAVELGDLVDEVAAALQPEIERSGGRVRVPRPLPVVSGHVVALRQVFRNLLINALTYRAPHRPPVVNITAECTEGGWRIIVADNGLGIPAGKHEAVFEPGVRLAAVPSEGSGLGLAAARTLVERHGGRIVADDNPAGPGARFLIDLPDAPPMTGSPVQRADPEHPARGAGSVSSLT